MSTVGNEGSQGQRSAICRVDAAGGLTAGYNRLNVVSGVKNGAGDYTVTLDEGLASSSAMPIVQPLGAATGVAILSIAQASATVWNIKFVDGDKAAVDSAFHFYLLRTYPG